MAAARLHPLRPLLSLSRPTPRQTRPFSLPSLPDLSTFSPSVPAQITARRQLPYPSPLLYSIISDISSYSSFLPFCTSSVVHSHTTPPPSRTPPTSPTKPPTSAATPPHNQATPPRPLPKLATLTVGWGPFPSESYTSRVYCIPGSTVEAVSGEAQPSTPWHVLRRYGYHPEDDLPDKGQLKRAGDGELFKSLATKWTVTPAAETTGDGDNKTDVQLRIEYLLANPLHQVAVGGVVDQVADKMIRAFEERAKRLFAEWKRREGARYPEA